jgi:hypothetical protein
MKHLMVLFLALAHGICMAADPMRALLDRAGDASTYPGEDAVTVFDSTYVEVQASGLTYVTSHTLVKVLTAKGAMDQDAIRFGYDPLSAYVEIRKAWIHRSDSSVEKLDLKNVLDYPAPAHAIYWGAREIMLGTGRLEPGDAVEVIMFRKGFTYALLQADEDGKYIPPMRGHFYDIVDFYSSSPVLEKVYQVNIPVDKKLQYQFYNGEATVSAWLEGDHYLYTFSKKKIMPLKTEPRMVSLSDVAPKLLLSTSPDWKAKSVWFFNVNEEFGSFTSTPEIKAKVSEILQGAASEEDSITRLTHWCGDEIRYSGISMGKGEGYTLHKGSMTFTDRCGVCKDKAGMLITMLRAAGFNSYPAMTMAGSRIDYIPADQFNHCVTIVQRRDGQYELLDPTWVPFVRELWSSAEQQQQYLMGVPEGADLETTPLSPPENHYVKINGHSELTLNGTLKGTITLTAEGQSDASVRGMLRGTKPELWRTALEKEVLKVHPKAQVTRVDFPDPYSYKTGPVKVTIDYIIPEYAVISDGIILYTPVSAVPIFRNFQPQLYFDTGPEERQYPFRDRCSRLVEISETTVLPGIAKAVRIPDKAVQDGTTASFNGGYTLQDSLLTYTAKAVFSKRIYEASDWPEFREAVKGQSRFGEQPVILKLQDANNRIQH